MKIFKPGDIIEHKISKERFIVCPFEIASAYKISKDVSDTTVVSIEFAETVFELKQDKCY